MSAVERFLEYHGELHDLGEARGCLEWDQQVMMPPKGVEQRGQQMAILARLQHERLCDPRYGELIEAAAAAPADARLAADLREARRVRDRALRVPASLVAERTRACALAESAWETARAANDFGAFLSHLSDVVRLTCELARCWDSTHLYGALLEEYEPGMTTEALESLFAELRPSLAALLARIQGAADEEQSSPLRGHFPVEAQQALCRELVLDMGFDLDAGRLDRSAHPFTAGTLRDVRITNRYDESSFAPAISGALHEAGHGLYEQGLDPACYRRPSGGACSLGMHESQSRFWENVVGRSRAFWRRITPRLRQRFPGVTDSVEPEDLYRAVNRVRPSLIRVDADELTYNLHIMLRYRLERALLEGDLPVADLPGSWREAMLRDVGVEPPDDRRGAMQDIHWAAGLIGYFPTYTLGNLYAAQLASTLRRERPDLDEIVEGGRLVEVREWLRTRIHSQGTLLPAAKLCEQVTGHALSAQPFVDYLTAKLKDVYGL